MSSTKPAATPVASKDKPVKALEEDDEFEDFPAEGRFAACPTALPKVAVAVAVVSTPTTTTTIARRRAE
jgi:hypothetical protein